MIDSLVSLPLSDDVILRGPSYDNLHLSFLSSLLSFLLSLTIDAVIWYGVERQPDI